MNEKYDYSACGIARDDKAARVAAARCNGLSNPDDIQIIDGIPEYRPKPKSPQSNEPLPPPSSIDLIP